MQNLTQPPSFSQQPASYPRRVLLAVSGLSPQIVTETLYALAVADRSAERFVPTEVHIITTLEGAQRAELSLLSADVGWFHRLRADYQLPPIAFGRAHIHVMRDARGQEMGDIRSIEDNGAAADFITAQVRQLSADPQCALHVSIAGGRKTMGFYLGYALSLYGRAQDRLSHVLVSEPFENTLEFFYPSAQSRVLQMRGGQWADAAAAQVTLAEIPFVSLRQDLPQALLSGHASFGETVAAARAALAPPELAIDLRGRRVRAGSQAIALPPAELALLAVFARRVIAQAPALPAPSKGSPDRDWADRFLREYRAILGQMGDADSTERTLKGGMEGEYFSICKSRLEKRLRAVLGAAAKAYRIDDGGKRPRQYRLTLAPGSLRFVESMAFEAGRP